MIIKIKRLHPDLILPHYAHEGDAGLDLYSLEDYNLKPAEHHIFRLGFALEIPRGYVGLVWDRSGLAAKHGLTILGGVIDATFRGECVIIVSNTSEKSHLIKKGERIAQLLIQKIESIKIKEVKELNQTNRGKNGLGSSGK